MEKVNIQMIEEAYSRLKGVVTRTPLELNKTLSDRYGAKIYLKREDQQLVRSYKLRGAYNCISLMSEDEKKKGVVCASAGNHAQGVAFSCATLGVKGVIFMPKSTPKQKLERVKVLGGEWVETRLEGEVFDESFLLAKEYCDKNGMNFVHPFDDPRVIAGQGTVGLEIVEQLKEQDVSVPDFVAVPIGGGGLVSGLGTYMKYSYPSIQLVGVEPLGAPSMKKSLEAGKLVRLEKIDKFVDGASTHAVGELTFSIAKDLIDDVLLVPEGAVCVEMISLYQSDGLVIEPAGALAVASLEQMKEKIRGKTVVCIVSGGNNDISRYPEIVDRSLIYKGLKHYFIVEFSQRPGALREYLDNVLGPNDDITLFEYIKKSNKETGPVLIGVELSYKTDLQPLLERMNNMGLVYEKLNEGSPLFRFLV